MKNFLKILAACSVAVTASSCDSFLDINDNPNSPLKATADAIMAQALARTASNYAIAYNPYGAFAVGQVGKSGTVNGYNEERTYNYNSSFSQGLFNNTYDNLYDYDLIEKQGKLSNQPNHSAIAEIMKVYNFQLLVDEYGDIPYTEALKGGSNISPKYDKAEDIYKDFIVKLNTAIDEIKAASADENVLLVGAEDIVFGGNMTNWMRFANSLKLRILMRQSSTGSTPLDAYVHTEMTKLQADAAASGGFITTDVLAQPGYTQVEGQQNPFFNRYRADASGSSATERLYTLPTKFLLTQYVNNSDPRGVRLYNTLGGKLVGVELGENLPVLGNAGSRFRDNGGVFKGYDAPVPLMLLADDLFTRSEAKARNYFTGGDAAAKTDFNNGITASFTYYYQNAPRLRGSTAAASFDSSAYVNRPIYVPTAADLAAVAAGTLTQAQLNTKVRLESGKVARYMAANVNNGLVNWDATTTTIRNAQSPAGVADPAYTTPLATPRTVTTQEKIIYQKYLANNGVASIEAWDDYRRTGYPRFKPSLQSTSTRADKLPVRLLYPLTEVTSNSGNLPAASKVANFQFDGKIFWDVQD